MMRNGQYLSWDPIITLFESKKKKNLRKSFKLNAMNVYPDGYAKMQVKYAAQVLSRTVAQDLEDQDWEGTSELIGFIRFVNDWFDCLNGAHSNMGKRMKNEKLNTYKSADDTRFDFILSFSTYLDEWDASATSVNAANLPDIEKSNISEGADGTLHEPTFASDDQELEDPNSAGGSVKTASEASKRKLSRQTLEGIEMTTRAFIPMVRFLLAEGTEMINARVFCQDPLEQHFSKLRAGQGGSTNPNVRQVLNRNRALHTIGEMGMKRRKGNAGEIDCSVKVTDQPLQKRRRTQ